ncbi:MAG: M48 family metallopeptidase [Chloroflexi bacterium]|nr:M48 family metallopeptidase [Chloroflexota bacterium]
MHQIDVNELTVDIVRKDIKNLHLAVYPPSGRVRVAAPLRVDDKAVRLAVITRLAWIKRQQAKFDAQERETRREYLNGESHYYQGGRYRLNIIEWDAPPQVIVRNKQYIDLYIRPGSDTAKRERVITAWYRKNLKGMIPPLIKKWEQIIGVDVPEWGVKQMKTKWGSCNIEAGRIWVNLELVKKSTRCLEFIVVHEMVHLMERRHNERFVELMTQFMPQWRQYRDELNRAPLAHAKWGY